MQSKKLNPLFDEMERLVNLQDEEKFNQFVKDNSNQLMKDNPLAFISYQVDFFAIKDDFSKTMEVINHYKNAPYISMEVEDFLNETKAKLQKFQRKENKPYSLEQLESDLLSGKEDAIANSLSYLSKQNIRMYLPVISKFLLSTEIKYKYKTLAIFILIQQKVDEEIQINKDGLIYTMTPTLIDMPFDAYEYELCKKEIENSKEEINIIQVAIELMNTVQIKEFPDSFIDMDNYKDMKEVFLYMARNYSSPNEDKAKEDKELEYLAKKIAMNLAELKELVETLNQVIIK